MSEKTTHKTLGLRNSPKTCQLLVRLTRFQQVYINFHTWLPLTTPNVLCAVAWWSDRQNIGFPKLIYPHRRSVHKGELYCTLYLEFFLPLWFSETLPLRSMMHIYKVSQFQYIGTESGLRCTEESGECPELVLKLFSWFWDTWVISGCKIFPMNWI